MIIGTGVDIIEVAKFEVDQLTPRFFERVYTPAEIIQAGGSAQKLAERFTLKEAVMKSLSAGIRQGVWLRQIETNKDVDQGWRVLLTGPAAKIRTSLGISEINVSVSNSKKIVVAMAICLGY
jgi:holo-[acyl-carrier protein] synthase